MESCQYREPVRRIALVLFPGARLFDVAVATETWAPHRTAAGLPEFTLRTCAPGSAPVPLTGGVTAVPDHALDWLSRADLVIVPGLDDPGADVPEELLGALRAAHGAGTTIAALCAGAFVLAAAGLLDDRPAITHWALAGELARRYPRVRVDPRGLFVGADGLWTSAGVAAGIDLCLHLTRLAHGAEVASTIARAMVTAPFRTGGQAQFVTTPIPATDRDADAIGAIQDRALRELHRPLTVAEMAGWASMSSRTFARRFVAATGTTPVRWLRDQRIGAAQRLLERTDLPIDSVAGRCGFGSVVTFRQHFTRHVGLAPRDYRRAFGPGAPTASGTVRSVFDHSAVSDTLYPARSSAVRSMPN
ncbi:MAG: helix-turn-helix domain-containing protein [Actinobacteria bacterium]|nr:helix-turn-helix domain-containing protein [Actinomycetota bacterium]